MLLWVSPSSRVWQFHVLVVFVIVPFCFVSVGFACSDPITVSFLWSFCFWQASAVTTGDASSTALTSAVPPETTATGGVEEGSDAAGGGRAAGWFCCAIYCTSK